MVSPSVRYMYNLIVKGTFHIPSLSNLSRLFVITVILWLTIQMFIRIEKMIYDKKNI